MDEQRRYADEPDPLRYTGGSSYDPGLYQRPDDAYRLAGDSGAAYAGRDGSAPGFSFGAPPEPPGDLPTTPPRSALDAIRVPLRPTEYPAPRPTAEPPPIGGPAAVPPPIPPPREPAGFGTPVRPEHARPDQARPDLTRADPLRPEPMRSDPIRPDQARPDPIRPDLSRSEHTGPEWAGPEPVGSDRQQPGWQQSERVTARRGGDTVYRSRRPASAVVFAVVTALLLVPAVRLLLSAAFADAPTAQGIVPAVLLTLGLPLTGAGLYGVTGAGGAVDRGVFLRPPAGYLPVGLVLLVAAGLAVA